LFCSTVQDLGGQGGAEGEAGEAAEATLPPGEEGAEAQAQQEEDEDHQEKQEEECETNLYLDVAALVANNGHRFKGRVKWDLLMFTFKQTFEEFWLRNCHKL
jgi:hypothetical protein